MTGDTTLTWLLIEGDVSTASASIEGAVSQNASLAGEITLPVGEKNFTGEYEYTPTEEEQVVGIKGLKATNDIKINPIPSNYGLITWDGSTLTVS